MWPQHWGQLLGVCVRGCVEGKMAVVRLSCPMPSCSCPMLCKWWLFDSWGHSQHCTCVTRHLIGHRPLLFWKHISAPPENVLRATFSLHHGSEAVPTMSTTKGENTACLLLRLLCQAGKNKYGCNSYLSWSFLPASLLTPCLLWVQWTVYTVRYSETIGIVSRISETTV